MLDLRLALVKKDLIKFLGLISKIKLNSLALMYFIFCGRY